MIVGRGFFLKVALGCLLAIAVAPSGLGAKVVGAAAWQAVGVTPVEPAPAPALTLSDLAGRPVGLDEFRGRVVMLYFWATW